MNIVSELRINEEQANSGCVLQVELIDGKGDLVIPKGTKNRTILRIKNRGVPKLGDPESRGDHLVHILVR